jgi:predicted acylesterase/phospholipase RssA
MSDASVNKPKHSVCSTFVVAKHAVNADGPPAIFRSYCGDGVSMSKCAIWQAVRATTASPSLFKPMHIEEPRPGGTYIDGGIGFNNPSEIALVEARRIWTTTDRKFCLVSIGTGRQAAVRITRDNDDIHAQRSAFEYLEDYIPEIVKFGPGWREASSLPPRVVALIKMQSALSSLITDSEGVHQRLQRDSQPTNNETRFPYFRFNVERDINDIGLGEWKRKEEMAAYTESYLRQHELEQRKIACARCVIDAHKGDSLLNLTYRR